MTLTTDEWVAKLNALSLEMDALADMVHPTVWTQHGMEEMKEEWRQIVSAPIQDALFDLPEQADGSSNDGAEVCL